MTIKCHYDGRVFVPDEPVKLAAGEPAEVQVGPDEPIYTGGPGGTVADLLAADFIGGWSGYDDDIDSLELAQEFRRRASMSSYHKQRAFLDLHEYWDEQRAEEDIQGGRAEGDGE